MAVLDHTRFPRLVEQIAALAPFELRGASREWPARVDRGHAHWRIEAGEEGRFIPFIYRKANRRRPAWVAAGDFDAAGSSCSSRCCPSRRCSTQLVGDEGAPRERTEGPRPGGVCHSNRLKQ